MNKLLTAFLVLAAFLAIFAACDPGGVIPGGGETPTFQGVIYEEGLAPFFKNPLYWNGDNGFLIGDTANAYTGSTAFFVDWSAAGDWNAVALEMETGSADLSGFNALTFYAKADSAVTIDKFGMVAEAGTNLEIYIANVDITTTWTKYFLPIPNPALLSNVVNVFYVADGVGDKIYLDDIKFESLSGITVTSLAYSGGDLTTTTNTPVSIDGVTATFSVGGTNPVVGGAVASYLSWTTTTGTAGVASGSVSSAVENDAVVEGSLGGQSVSINVGIWDSVTTALVDNFDDGDLADWQDLGDYGNGATFDATWAATTAQFVSGTHSMVMPVTVGGWGIGGTYVFPLTRDWTGYNAVRLETFGSNSGAQYKVVLRDTDGTEIEPAPTTETTVGWHSVVFPFSSMSIPGAWANGADGVFDYSKIAEAKIVFTSGTGVTLYFDDYKAVDTTALVDNFDDGDLAGWVDLGDYGNGATWTATWEATTAQFVSGTHSMVMPVSVGGWGIGGSYRFSTPRDFSGYTGMSLEVFGSNSGAQYKVVLRDSDGTEIEPAVATETTVGWHTVTFTLASMSIPGAWANGADGVFDATAISEAKIVFTSGAATLYFDDYTAY